MLEILSRIANRVKSSKFDTFLENMECKKETKERNRRLARTLAQARSVMRAVR